MRYFVYIHIVPNGKKYVGVTTLKPQYRWKGGLGYKTQTFNKAVEKYGWDNITHEVFEVNTREEMYYLERYLIAFYNTYGPGGYNCSSGGETSALGHKVSKESRKRISEGHTGKHLSEETKRKISKGNKGKHQSEESRKRISEAKTGIPKVKYLWYLQDGTTKIMAKNTAHRNYLNKGIQIEKGPRIN